MKRMIGVAAVMAAAVVQGAEFALVKDGVAQVRFEGVMEPAQALATNEFHRIVEKVTGAKPNAVAPNVIRFAVDPSLGGSDTYEIREEGRGKSIVLVGNNVRSTWFAMLDLLGQLGCRWFWEGPDGEFLPPASKDLSLDVKAKKTTAAFPIRRLDSHASKERALFFAHYRLNPIGYHNRYDWGQPRGWGGHSFGHIHPADCKDSKEYFAKHPEQWALFNGIRVDGNHCYTNPDTIKTFQDWILRFWAEHPEVDFLTLTAKDSPVFCHCPECSKVDSSTLFFTFINKIIEPSLKKYPDKRYMSIAYSFYLNVPKVRVSPAVVIDYCMYNRCYKHTFGSDCKVNRKALQAMADWKDALGHASGIYGYHFDALSKGFHCPFARILQDELKWARDYGVESWHTEYYMPGQPYGRPRGEWSVLRVRWSAWAAQQLLWDPDLDLEALRTDYCSRVFGAGAKEIAEYLKLLETAWEGEGHIAYYANSAESIADGYVRDPNLLKRIDKLLSKATEKTRGDARAALEVDAEKAAWEPWRKLATGPSTAKRWTMTVPYSKEEPNMDGTGADPVWDKCGVTEKEFVPRGSWKKNDPCWATVLRTDKGLFLRFIGWGDMSNLKQSKKQRDEDVYMDDGVELYLDPNNTRTDYFWVCVNTIGTVEDALASVGMNINHAWNGKFRTASKVYDDRWVIEVEFPYAVFGGVKPDTPWLMGVNRCGPGYQSSWTDATVHSPSSFRTLIME